MKIKSFFSYILLAFLFVFSYQMTAQVTTINLLSNEVVWEEASHNAFTTLESFGDYLYCAFRESTSHKSYDGKIRIVRSKDGKKWESVAIVKSRQEDLRDPKLIVNDGKIFLLMVSRTPNKHYSYTYSSINGLKWTFLEKSNDTWRWNATRNKNTVYSIGYSGKDKLGNLYKTTNGKQWNSLKSNFFSESKSQPNETKLFFTDEDKMVALVRHEKGNQNAFLGVSNPPYTSWNWKDLGFRLGSPAGIVLNNKEILTCVRMYDSPVRLSFVKINIEDGTYKEIMAMPSGGDTGYADIVKHKGAYYMSYYSSKNNNKKTKIYLAKFEIK